MSRYLPFLPIVLGVCAIVGLTIPQVLMSDRFAGGNVSAEQKKELLKRIPKKIGDWQGEDMAIDETVRQTAGAVGAVSRIYRNSRTGDKVDLWLIVGHGREIAAHTPNICYQASGFVMQAAENSLYPMVFPGLEHEAPFLTNTFIKEDSLTGRRLIRVFWSWFNTENADNKGEVIWEAPPNARWHFGNTRALFKMYFTSEMKDALETADNSACLRFAREFLPIVNEALADVQSGAPIGDAAAAKPAEAEPTADAAATETPTKPASETPADSAGLFEDAQSAPGETKPGTSGDSATPAAAPAK